MVDRMIRFGIVLTCIAVLAATSYGVTTVYNSAGFTSFNLGAIDAQDSGKWDVGSGQPSDAGAIIDIGGTNGKVLSFKTGASYNVRVLLNYQGTSASTIVKWSYDFYQQQPAGVLGAIYSYRDAGLTTPLTKLLPEQAHFNVELRRESPLGTYWPSSWLADYEGRYSAPARWHHVEVYEIQNTTQSETPGRVKVYVDGIELTRWYSWYTISPYYVATIGAIDFNPNVAEGSAYYIDNLKVEEGSDIQFPAANPVHTIYNVNGFNNFSLGSVDGQDSGAVFFDNGSKTPTARSPWYVLDMLDNISVYGDATIVSLPDADEHVGRGKVLSFTGTGPNYTSGSMMNIWCDIAFEDWFGYGFDANNPNLGVYYTGGTVVKWSYDFYQTDGIYGAVASRRNSNDVIQAWVLPECGNIVFRAVGDSPDGQHVDEFIGNFELDKWHHLEVYQFQPLIVSYTLPPAEYPIGPMRLFIDGVELTQKTYYSFWAGWTGHFDSLQWYPTVSNDLGERYYIDNLKIEEGVDISLPKEPCGAWGYLPGDLDRDCRVGFSDLAQFVEGWLIDTNIDSPIGQQVW